MRPTAFALAAILIHALVDDAAAQMFGNRNLGSSVAAPPSGADQARRMLNLPGVTMQAPVGTGNVAGVTTGNFSPLSMNMGLAGNSNVSPTARFNRANRNATTFVGSDSREGRGFIGSTQALDGGPIQSAVNDLRMQNAPDVNRPLPDPAAARPGPYRPKLKLGFTARLAAAAPPAARLQEQVTQALALPRQAPLQVTMDGRSAILEGVVASEHDRALAAELIRLEPGVGSVQNRLRVADELPAPPGSPAP